VISGKLRGETVTMPLQIELYYQEFRALAQVSAFTLAAVLAGLALVTLVAKTWLEWRYSDQLAATRNGH
jgi:sulfate transport system permease protein